jgi:stalled ribosome rescue protein Dom34
MPTLVELASDEAEVSVIRGDAIESIYLIESQLGKQYARQYRGDHEYLDHIASRILSDDTYFRESCEF